MNIKPDYKLDKEELKSFMMNFVSDKGNMPKYKEMLKHIANRTRKTLDISLDDVETYDFTDEKILERIENNTRRYLKLFAEAADDLMPEADSTALREDIYDVLKRTRERVARITSQQEDPTLPDGPTAAPQPKLPPELLRRYEVYVEPRSLQKPLKLREINARHVGRLVAVRGIVTHQTDVKPMITIATYLDAATGFEIYQEVTGRTFVPLLRPPEKVSEQAPAGQSGGGLQLETRGSKFVRYQECKLQELAEEVPQGATPRSITVHLRGELTRTCKPGELVTVAGVFLPEPFVGARGARAGLITSTYMEAQRITQSKRSYASELTCEEQEAVTALAQSNEIYARLARSIAPEIYGHEDVKRALLLMLVGGVTRVLGDAMKLRGDIHVCLMGDPGVAKSQLLKHIAHLSPRAVYTTGKGSSGVGLTAAVQRDPTTQEMVLEGGALVLADKGICCIDEFDKMEEGDRTAIHEVMEQQTVSIAKAGITTTLNTRTTVLAAANPAWGRYDTRRSPAENINLPAALLSRFDIMWLILDKADPENDRMLANHVLEVHRTGRAPVRSSEGVEMVPANILRSFIATAKQHQPTVPESLTEYIAAVYAEMRAEEAATEQPHSYTTARTLLSILRLAQALARLRWDDSICQSDVDEALRLMRMSKISLLDDTNRARSSDPISDIYTKIRDDALRNRKASYRIGEITQLVGAGFTREQIRACLEEYNSLNVWQLDTDQAGEPVEIHLEGIADEAEPMQA